MQEFFAQPSTACRDAHGIDQRARRSFFLPNSYIARPTAAVRVQGLLGFVICLVWMPAPLHQSDGVFLPAVMICRRRQTRDGAKNDSMPAGDRHSWLAVPAFTSANFFLRPRCAVVPVSLAAPACCPASRVAQLRHALVLPWCASVSDPGGVVKNLQTSNTMTTAIRSRSRLRDGLEYVCDDVSAVETLSRGPKSKEKKVPSFHHRYYF